MLRERYKYGRQGLKFGITFELTSNRRKYEMKIETYVQTHRHTHKWKKRCIVKNSDIELESGLNWWNLFDKISLYRWPFRCIFFPVTDELRISHCQYSSVVWRIYSFSFSFSFSLSVINCALAAFQGNISIELIHRNFAI